jgi:hypothetical protein
MTTITLELPDDLATQLVSMRDRLPALLYEVLNSKHEERAVGRLKSGGLHPAYREMFHFLAAGPTPEQIISHRPAAQLRERVAELLEKNRESGLTAEEEAELDDYEQVDDLMSLLKARARSVIP